MEQLNRFSEVELDSVNEDLLLQRTINDLPDEILENIFGRLSPYTDLDAARSVSLRWNRLAKVAIRVLKTQFQLSLSTGKFKCTVQPAICENYRTAPGWPQERFGQSACYYDKCLYIIGGSTHRTTTFNDFWKYDLGSRSWSRIISRGNYPSPKALATCVQNKDNFYLFGGWTHPSSSPFMAPWRLFDELHRYNITSNTWHYIVGTNNPPPMAGHSCSTSSREMIVFGGRTYDLENQRYPVSNDVWVFDYREEEWYSVQIDKNSECPGPRYGQTQVELDEFHILIIGGCDGPTKIYNDAWLLSLTSDLSGRRTGTWKTIQMRNGESKSPPSDFHYSGSRVGHSIVFFQQISCISPYLAFLHFDSHNLPPLYQNGIIFEASKEPFTPRRLQNDSNSYQKGSHTMGIYSLDLSQLLEAPAEAYLTWRKEKDSGWNRPDERFLYSLTTGRSELILFGGFFKEPNGRRCRVSSDVFILSTVATNY